MIAARKKKLQHVLFIVFVVSIALALILYALRQNISLFYTPTQLISGEAPIGRAIRVGGMVEQGSIMRPSSGLTVQFNITDFNKKVSVTYQGVLPDLFRDGQGVVVEGVLQDTHQIQASQVLAKHDANYMPPEVKAAMAKKYQDSSLSSEKDATQKVRE